MRMTKKNRDRNFAFRSLFEYGIFKLQVVEVMSSLFCLSGCECCSLDVLVVSTTVCYTFRES